ncbi:MAG: hypothetical protein CV087_20000 [Candidatus Brocadia sp. WS118]|nr:MAG: hypothetical protein CV087_20000 [Candidatus Brocadia sp. WS118]
MLKINKSMHYANTFLDVLKGQNTKDMRQKRGEDKERKISIKVYGKKYVKCSSYFSFIFFLTTVRMFK